MPRPRRQSQEPRGRSRERQEDRGSDTPRPTVTFSSKSPYQIQIASLPQRITRVYRIDNHPLWTDTARQIPGRNVQPDELCIPSPSEQMKLQNKAVDKIGEDTQPDLFDIDAQISHCQEVIASHEEKLEGYKKWKQEWDNCQHDPGEPPGLSWNVYQRLETLKNIEQHLKRHDPHDHLQNVQSIIKSYRSGKLVWSDELATLWCQGQQISRPMPFHWDFFERINSRYRNTGDKIWVEAMGGPGVQLRRVNKTVPTTEQKLFKYPIALRLPFHDWYEKLEIGWDGTEEDLDHFMNGMYTVAAIYRSVDYSKTPSMGMVDILNEDGSSEVLNVVEAEATILNHEGARLTPWVRTQCLVMPEKWTTEKFHEKYSPLFRLLFFNAVVPHVGRLPSIPPIQRQLYGLPENLTPYTGKYSHLIHGPGSCHLNQESPSASEQKRRAPIEITRPSPLPSRKKRRRLNETEKEEENQRLERYQNFADMSLIPSPKQATSSSKGVK